MMMYSVRLNCICIFHISFIYLLYSTVIIEINEPLPTYLDSSETREKVISSFLREWNGILLSTCYFIERILNW